MTTATVQSIAASYGHPRPAGTFQGRDVFRIPCPAHKGKDRNLALWEGDGGSLAAVCHSRGCSFQNILDALGEEFTYEARTYKGRRPDGAIYEVKRRRGPGKDFKGNFESPKGLLVKLAEGDAYENTVTLVEGEKAFDALASYALDGYTAAHWVGGAGLADQADYSPLKGRDVILWPGNDKSGLEAMQKAAIMAEAAGATSLRMVDVAALPAKADAADVPPTGAEALLASAEEYVTPPTTSPDVKDAAEGSGFDRGVAEGLHAALLQLRLELRLNSRGGRVEMRRSDYLEADGLAFANRMGLRPGLNGWSHVNQYAEDALRNYLALTFRDIFGKRFYLGTDRFRSFINALVAPVEKTVDPVIEWLEALTPWDGQQRLARLFIDTLGAKDTGLVRAAAVAFTAGAIQRAYQPGIMHDWAPVLVGPQGWGKTTFCQWLIPPEGRRDGWYRSINNLADTEQKLAEAVANAWLVELKEMRGAARVDQIKTFLDTATDTYRRPFHKDSTSQPRRWAAIGTGNDRGDGVLPDDSSGTRRWLTIEVDPCGLNCGLCSTPGISKEARSRHVREYLDTHRDLLWAEALKCYREGAKGFLGELWEGERDKVNMAYVKANQPLDEIAAQLTTDHANGEPLTLADLLVKGELATSVADAQVKAQTVGRQLAGYLLRYQWSKNRARIDGKLATWWTPPILKDSPAELPSARECPRCGRARAPEDIDLHGQCIDDQGCDGARGDGPPPPGAASGGLADGAQQRVEAQSETARAMRAHYEAAFSTIEGPAKREGVQVMAAEMQVASWHGLIEALQANASTLPESAVTVLGGQDALLDHLAGFIERYCDFPFDAKAWTEELLPDLRRAAVQATEDARERAQAQLLKRGAALQQLAMPLEVIH